MHVDEQLQRSAAASACRGRSIAVPARRCLWLRCPEATDARARDALASPADARDLDRRQRLRQVSAAGGPRGEAAPLRGLSACRQVATGPLLGPGRALDVRVG